MGKPKNAVKRVNFALRMTTAERQMLDTLAESEGRTAGSMIRSLIRCEAERAKQARQVNPR